MAPEDRWIRKLIFALWIGEIQGILPFLTGRGAGSLKSQADSIRTKTGSRSLATSIPFVTKLKELQAASKFPLLFSMDSPSEPNFDKLLAASLASACSFYGSTLKYTLRSTRSRDTTVACKTSIPGFGSVDDLAEQPLKGSALHTLDDWWQGIAKDSTKEAALLAELGEFTQLLLMSTDLIQDVVGEDGGADGNVAPVLRSRNSKGRTMASGMGLAAAHIATQAELKDADMVYMLILLLTDHCASAPPMLLGSGLLDSFPVAAPGTMPFALDPPLLGTRAFLEDLSKLIVGGRTASTLPPEAATKVKWRAASAFAEPLSTRAN